MKIYFEDGVLVRNNDLPYSKTEYYILDAKEGYTFCDNQLEILSHLNKKNIVYTNQITAISNQYAWNEELKVPEIFLRNRDDEWIRIDMLTGRELREGHNLMKMYVAGEFDKKLKEK